LYRFFITFSYDGTKYHGWQIQPNSISVQEILQRSLSIILRRKVEVVGAGRTDSGVHARMMVAHFDDNNDSLDCSQLVYKMNRILPPDISISSVKKVNSDMHARFSAISRTYHYYVHMQKSPFARMYSCEMHFPLDFVKMNEAARVLMEYNDFGAFCKSHTDVKTTICHLTTAQWISIDENHWYFEITANRFLRNMVRAIVGTLIDIGRGRISIDDLRSIIEGKKRSDAGESMPAKALFLEDIKY
jgi:tRNA pseudouridine38-40 synthase